MITVLTFLLGALAFLVSVPVLVLLGQVLLAYLPARAQPAAAWTRPQVAVLVPAHDEASIIGATLASLVPQLQAGDRLLVVADNCSDDTARRAEEGGAEVVVRQDALRRGKGYALDFGMRHLAADPRQVVIIVDADCRAEKGALEQLARRCAQSGRPVQALYLMKAPAGAGLKVQVAEFAWRVKNLVRPRGWARVGLPCQLMGSGMAFPWQDLAAVDLA
ncbi:glycosyltransferase family 2 protein, partial [uncultured Pseudomonas sp.]